MRREMKSIRSTALKAALGLLVAVFAPQVLAATPVLPADVFTLADNIGDESGIFEFGATLSGNPSPFPFTSRQAMPFFVTTPDGVSSPTLYAVEVTASTLIDNGPIHFYLAMDDGGYPDDLNKLYLGQATPVVPLGSGFDRLFLQTTSAPPLLPGSTYWLVLDTAPNTVSVWNRSNTGPAGQFSSASSGGWSSNSFSYGYAVYAVPEPATIGTAALGMLMLGGLRRRR